VILESPHFRINFAEALELVGFFREGDAAGEGEAVPDLAPLLARVGFIRDLRACTFLAISSAVKGFVLSSERPGAGTIVSDHLHGENSRTGPFRCG
jgi:hypothetical protein